MKISKKAAMGISLAVGTLMFATTAFAEVASKSGYEQLKDAFKYSADSCSSKLQNYTINTSFIIKDNGKIVSQQDSVNKYDISKNAKEITTSDVDAHSAKTESYYYADKDEYINYNSNEGIYNEVLVTGAKNYSVFSNPFKEKREADIEKIADAVVGNLKDYVVVNQKADGSRELSGSISKAQIPAIANAVVSYEVKGIFENKNNPYDKNKYGNLKISDDVYVKEIKGDMTTDKDGLIQTAEGTGIISGKDDQGKIHELTFEVLGKLTDINSTSVKKPDLTGKNVKKDVQEDYDTVSNPQMYIGTYKNDIVIKKDGKFQKIGDRIVDITGIDDKKVSGRYHEEYAKGYDEYSGKAEDFKFSADFNKDQKTDAEFTITDTSGKAVKGNIDIDVHSGNIYLSFEKSNNANVLSNSQYSREFN